MVAELLGGTLTVFDARRTRRTSARRSSRRSRPAAASGRRVDGDTWVVASRRPATEHLGTLVLADAHELEPGRAAHLRARRPGHRARAAVPAQPVPRPRSGCASELLADLSTGATRPDPAAGARPAQRADLDGPADGRGRGGPGRRAAPGGAGRRPLGAVAGSAGERRRPGRAGRARARPVGRRRAAARAAGGAAGGARSGWRPRVARGRPGVRCARPAAAWTRCSRWAGPATSATPRGWGWPGCCSATTGRGAGRLRRGLVGPVLGYDAERGTSLGETLEAWFEAGGSPRRPPAAARPPQHGGAAARAGGPLLGDRWREPARGARRAARAADAAAAALTVLLDHTRPIMWVVAHVAGAAA